MIRDNCTCGGLYAAFGSKMLCAVCGKPKPEEAPARPGIEQSSLTHLQSRVNQLTNDLDETRKENHRLKNRVAELENEKLTASRSKAKASA